jgi:ubiquitin carboxyl-terminal hydrolase 7
LIKQSSKFKRNDPHVFRRQSTNAYMLVYIRKSALRDILCPVTQEDIPLALVDRLNEEKKLEIAKRKEKNDAHLYMTLRVLTEDDFAGHQGNDLYDSERVQPREIRVRKEYTLKQVMDVVAAQMKHSVNRLRIWPLSHRTNQTLRPSLVDADLESEKTFYEVADTSNVTTVFLEIADPEKPDEPLQPFDKDQDVMLFFKYYDPRREKIHYMGHMYVAITAKVSAMVPELCRRACLPEDTRLSLYEEIKPNMLERIEDIEKPLEHVLEELMDGDIIVFQVDISSQDSPYRLPQCRDYFRDLFYKVDVTFVDKNAQSEPGFTLTLSQRMTYSQIAREVAAKLEVGPDYVQFFKSQGYRDQPGNPLRCTFEGTLKDLLTYARPKQPRRLFYQKLAIPIQDLENKRPMKCQWVSPDGKQEQEITLYPPKHGTVADLLEEARENVSNPFSVLYLRMSLIARLLNNVIRRSPFLIMSLDAPPL